MDHIGNNSVTNEHSSQAKYMYRQLCECYSVQLVHNKSNTAVYLVLDKCDTPVQSVLDNGAVVPNVRRKVGLLPIKCYDIKFITPAGDTASH
jgi:hypothetical protein